MRVRRSSQVSPAALAGGGVAGGGRAGWGELNGGGRGALAAAACWARTAADALRTIALACSTTTEEVVCSTG